MSNLNHVPVLAITDAEDLIEITSYDEMVARVGFEVNIDPQETKPAKIKGHYQFSKAVACGLSNCHRKHLKGYLVATTDGRETNIGHICGKNNFGHDFAVLRNSYESRRRIKDYRGRLGEFKARLPVVVDTIKCLKERDEGAEWLYRIQRAFKAGAPQALIDNLHTRARTGEAHVTRVKTLQGAEAELRLAAEGKWSSGNLKDTNSEPTYVTQELVGQIKGLSIWGASIREELVDGLERDLLEFDQRDIYSLSETKLRGCIAIIDGVESRLQKCETLVADGLLFFTEQNITIVRQIPLPPDAAKELRRCKWNSQKGVWKKI